MFPTLLENEALNVAQSPTEGFQTGRVGCIEAAPPCSSAGCRLWGYPPLRTVSDPNAFKRALAIGMEIPEQKHAL